MPYGADHLDTRLRALTRQAFDDAVAARRGRGRLATRKWRPGPVTVAFALAAAVGIIGALSSPLFPQNGGTRSPAGLGTQRTPNPQPVAGPLPVQAALTRLDSLASVAVDATGNLYLAEGWLRRIVRISAQGVPSVFAGPAPPGSLPMEDGPAATGIFGGVLDVAVDARGDVYVLDSELGVRRIGPDGTISTLARRGGAPVYPGVPWAGGSIAVTASGTVYVACGDCRLPGSQATSDVYAILTDGSVRVVAGGGVAVTGARAAGLAPGAAGSTLLSSPLGVAVDARGDVFIADSGNNRIREIGVDGSVSTVAGSDGGDGGVSGDNGPATKAKLNDPVKVAVDAHGDLFILDANDPVREVSSGIIRTVDAEGDQHPPMVQPSTSRAVRTFFTSLGVNHLQAIGPDGGIVTLF